MTEYSDSLDDLIVHANKVLKRLIRWQIAEENESPDLARHFETKAGLVDRAIDLLLKAKVLPKTE